MSAAEGTEVLVAGGGPAGLIAACALIISPLGYLLINPLTTAAANAASVF